MKLLRHSERGSERPGLLDAVGQVRDLSGVVSDSDGAVQARLDMLRGVDVSALPLVGGTGSARALPAFVS